MNLYPLAALLLCVLALTGCINPRRAAAPIPTGYVPLNQIQITSHFNTREISSDTFEAEANRCISNKSSSNMAILKARQNFPRNETFELSHPGAANRFLVTQTTALCLQKSSNRQPIFAAEVFFKTINPVGVPPEVTDRWYKELALLIATKGSANVAYVFSNGNASIASYWVKSFPVESALNYSNNNKKAGTWESEVLDAKFSHPAMTSVSTIQRNNLYEKVNPIQHRFEQRKKRHDANAL